MKRVLAHCPRNASFRPRRVHVARKIAHRINQIVFPTVSSPPDHPPTTRALFMTSIVNEQHEVVHWNCTRDPLHFRLSWGIFGLVRGFKLEMI